MHWLSNQLFVYSWVLGTKSCPLAKVQVAMVMHVVIVVVAAVVGGRKRCGGGSGSGDGGGK
jgi:hypothetical protein